MSKKAILLESVGFLQTGARSNAETVTASVMALHAAPSLLLLLLTEIGAMVVGPVLVLLVAGTPLLPNLLVTGQTIPPPLLRRLAGKLSWSLSLLAGLQTHSQRPAYATTQQQYDEGCK